MPYIKRFHYRLRWFPLSWRAIVRFSLTIAASGLSTAKAAEVQFYMDNRTASQGATVTVPIRVSQFSLGGFQFSLEWPADALRFVGLTDIHSGLSGYSPDASFNLTDAANGRISTLWDNPLGEDVELAPDAVLFALRFDSLGETGNETEIAFSDSPTKRALASYAEDPQALEFISQNGLIQFADRPTISGAVRYYGHETAIRGVPMNLSGGNEASTSTDDSGHFTLEADAGNPATLYPSSLAGGSPNNGVTTLDILLIRRHILNPLNAASKLAGPHPLLAADVNEDQRVTTLDILLIRRLILNPVDFPYYTNQEQPLWKYVPGDHVFDDPDQPWGVEGHREYTAVDGSMTDQDFTAVKLGDANASWTQEP